MPEFDVVNLQVQYLRARCRGAEVTGYTIDGKGQCGNLPAAQRESALEGMLVGARIEDVTQRGKLVVFRIGGGVLTTHLMFKGRWSLESDPFISNYKAHREPPGKGRRFWLDLASGDALSFYEPENRGKVQVFPGLSPAEVPELAKLGPDVLSVAESDPDTSARWELADFSAAAGRNRKPIKALLLDQALQAGIGNMWACEGLYRAGIAPQRPARELSASELERLHRELQQAIEESIARKADYSELLAVYKRDADPHGAPVETCKIAGRDTYWVPDVQK